MALRRFEYEVGRRIKARDRTGKWYLASILEIDEDDQDLLVHFEGWNQRHDEWIDFGSDRLRPLTPNTAQQFSPVKWEPKVSEEVRARWTDKRLYLAKIVKISSEGTYKVRFHDGFELTLSYDDMRPTKKPANVPANRLREPLELAEGGSSGDKEEEEAKEGTVSKGRGERSESKSHSQSDKLKLEAKPKKPPTTSPESPKVANSGSGMSPQKTTRSGQTKRAKDGEDMPTTGPVTRRSEDKQKRSTTKAERGEKRSSPLEGESSSRPSRASPPSSGSAQKQQPSTSSKQQHTSRGHRSSRDQTSPTEQRPAKDRSSGREKGVSSQKEASRRDRSSSSKNSAQEKKAPKDEDQSEKEVSSPKEASRRDRSSSSKSHRSAQEKKSPKDEERREKERTARSDFKGRHSKEGEDEGFTAKDGGGKEKESGGTSTSKNRSNSKEGERVPSRSKDNSKEEGQSSQPRSGRERESRGHHGGVERPSSRKRSHPSGSSDGSSRAKLRKKSGESGGESPAASTPQSVKEKAEDLPKEDESLVHQPVRKKEGRKQRDEQREKTRKRKEKEEESTEGSKGTPVAAEPPRAISVSVIRTSSTATSSDSEMELSKTAKLSTKMATIREDSEKTPGVPTESGADLPSKTGNQDVTIVSISSSRRKAYTPQHVSSLPNSPTKGGFPQISPIHVTPGYVPDVLFQVSDGDVSQNSEKSVLHSTTRKLHLPASPTLSDSEIPLDFIKAKEESFAAFERQLSMPGVARGGGEPMPVGSGQDASGVEEVQSPSSKRELSSSGYNVAILNEDSPTQPTDDPAVIFIEPVRIASDKYTRQQSKSCTEKSSISEDMETAIEEDSGQKMSEMAGEEESAGNRASVSEDASESDTSVEVKRLKSCSLVLGEPPASRLRSQSLSSLPRDEGRSRRAQYTREEGSKIAIQNIQRFKRMTGLDVIDVAGVGKKVGKSPKEVVINVDHNAYKCRHAGCSKSFRKDALLQWHIKHYHPGIKPGKKTPGLVSKPRPTGLRSPPHSIVKKLAISRVRKTQQQKKEEPQMAPVAGPAAVLVEPQKRTEPEARPTLSALAVTEQKREAGAIGKSSTSLPPCTGVLRPMITTLPANITPHKPPLGRPPKRPSTESNKISSQTPTVTMETPATKQPKHSQPVDKETPKAAKPQGVRKRAAASTRQHRLKEFSDSEGASEEDSMDSLNASWRSFSSESLSLVSLDADVRFLDEEEGVELPRRDSSPGQPSGRGRVYNRYCSGHKDDVIHCVCSSFKEEGFMIQCDQCLSWQHGECVDVDEEKPPQDYICFACVHPRALRKSAKYKLDRMWFGSGKLLSHPEEPPFPHASAVLRSHRLAQELLRLRDIHHSVRLLLNLASDPSNPQLKHWSPAGHEDTIQHLKGILVNALMKSNSSLGNDIHEADTNPSSTGHRTASGTSAEELGGLTNRICSPVDQSEHSESHDDHMDTGEPPSGIVHVDSTATSLPHPQEGDSDADVTCVSHDDHMLISSSGDVASHDHSFQSLPPLHSLPPGHSFPAASTLSSFASSDDTHAADLFSLPLPPLPSNEDSSRSVLPLCGMEGVTSIGALLEEMERSEHAGGEALSVKATSDKVDQIRAAFALEEDEGASMDSELQGEAAPVAADLPTQLLAEGVVCCPIPLRSPLKTTASPLGAAMMMSSPQHGQQKASLLSLELSDQSPFKVVQQQQQVALPQAGGEDLSSPASPDFNTFSLLADLDDRQTTVPVSAFAESYVRSDPDDWCARMVLIERIAAIQDLIVQHMAVIEKEIEALPEVDPVISANGRSGPKKHICRKTIQELRHSIPMEQPKLSI